MEIIFLIGSIQAIIFLLLLITKKNKSFSDKILATWLLVMAGHLLLRYIYSTDIIRTFPHLIGIHAGIPLLYGPLLLLYVDSLTNNKQSFQNVFLLHFIPFFIVTFALIPFFLESTEYKLKLITGLENYSSKYIFITVLQLISGPIYVVWILLFLKRHKRNIGFHFSFTEKIELKWLKNLTLGLAGIWIIILLVYAIWEFSNFPISFDRELIIYTAVTIFIFIIGYKGLKQSPVFIDFQIYINQKETKSKNVKLDKTEIKNDRISLKETDTYINNSSKKDIQEDLNRLLFYMKEEKPYLRDKLMLSDVASAINIPHYRLTKIFNEILNKNFFNFVNSYRVEKVKEMLSDPKNEQFTILAIAFESGFSSKSAFNRIFKQMTNMTPSHYRKTL